MGGRAGERGKVGFYSCREQTHLSLCQRHHHVSKTRRDTHYFGSGISSILAQALGNKKYRDHIGLSLGDDYTIGLQPILLRRRCAFSDSYLKSITMSMESGSPIGIANVCDTCAMLENKMH